MMSIHPPGSPPLDGSHFLFISGSWGWSGRGGGGGGGGGGGEGAYC